MARALVCLAFFGFFALLYPRLVAPAIESVHEEVVDIAPPTLPSTANSEDAQKILTTDDKVMRFLEDCYKNYSKTVTTGYRTILTKQEWVQGSTKPNSLEVIEVDFREKPFSVYMKWKEGTFLVRRSLYVEGEHLDPQTKKSMMWVRPIFGWNRKVAVDSKLVKSSGRYTIDKFGVRWGLKRVLTTWRKRYKEGNLDAEFGKTVKLAEVGNRPCYRIHRKIPDHRPEHDGVLDVVLYVDVERKLQVGTVLKGIRGSNRDALIGKYFFNIVELNPPSNANGEPFSPKRLNSK